MSSILNTILSGNLQVEKSPRDGPGKIIKTCTTNSKVSTTFNTGFGASNELHYQDNCKKPTLHTPLYKENFLSEFKTKEDKALARKSLGIQNYEDVVVNQTLTTDSSEPSKQQLLTPAIKKLLQGNSFFSPITVTKAVYDQQGNNLETRLETLKKLINTNAITINSLNNETQGNQISSLGDFKKFVRGFKNGDDLKQIIDEVKEDMLKFQITGNIL